MKHGETTQKFIQISETQTLSFLLAMDVVILLGVHSLTRRSTEALGSQDGSAGRDDGDPDVDWVSGGGLRLLETLWLFSLGPLFFDPPTFFFLFFLFRGAKNGDSFLGRTSRVDLPIFLERKPSASLKSDGIWAFGCIEGERLSGALFAFYFDIP